jgi:O-antigen/teichoic acid export membrane protein
LFQILADYHVPRFLVTWLQRFGINLPVFFALVTQGVHLVNGIVLVFLISYKLSLEAQGFYYTFGSLVAIQLILDLDFQLVILVIASHEWSKLGINERGGVCGDPDALSRLAHQTAIAVRWYCCAGGVATITVGVAGWRLMAGDPHPAISWQAPWIALVALNGAIFWMRALGAVVEGCNEVLAINRMRLYESLLRAPTLWGVLLLGGGLWAPAAAAVVSVIWTVYFLIANYKPFFRSLRGLPQKARIDWRKEIWPIQWRMGLSGLLIYFAGNCFNPVMFYYHGAAIAGKTGMTLALVTALQAAGMAWLTPKRPYFGILVANREYKKLDRTWLVTAASSVATLILIAGAAWLLILFMNLRNMPLAERFLTPLTIAALFAWTALRQVSSSITIYLRAHKQDPTAVISVIASIASVLAIWRLGARYGPEGAAIGLLAISMGSLVCEILVWRNRRRRWRKTPG